MPPRHVHSGGARRSRVARLIVLALVIGGGGWGGASLGRLLHHEDDLEQADVIFVLSGSRVERVAEAADLYREGWAPRILLSRQISDPAEAVLRARGIDLPTEVDFQRELLGKLGVPSGVVDALDAEMVATSTESDALLRRATAHGWRRIIIVTSKLHTARARLAVQRRFAGTGTGLIMRASRYDRADIDRWWATRADLRFVLFETQKLFAYWLGLAD